MPILNEKRSKDQIFLSWKKDVYANILFALPPMGFAKNIFAFKLLFLNQFNLFCFFKYVQDNNGTIENEELRGFLKDLLELVKKVKNYSYDGFYFKSGFFKIEFITASRKFIINEFL